MQVEKNISFKINYSIEYNVLRIYVDTDELQRDSSLYRIKTSRNYCVMMLFISYLAFKRHVQSIIIMLAELNQGTTYRS